jgi:prepilin-type N-terminal cleavage/methylation domain-containing protein
MCLATLIKDRPFKGFTLQRKRPVPFCVCGKGFTLIELLLVLTLIGVFVGLVVPRIGVMFFDYEFHAAVERVEKVVRFAQQEAVNSDMYYRLTIDRTENTIQLFQKVPEAYDDYSAIPGTLGEVFALPESCELLTVRAEDIYFYPDGSTSRTQFSIRYKDQERVVFSFKGTPFGFSLTYK